MWKPLRRLSSTCLDGWPLATESCPEIKETRVKILRMSTVDADTKIDLAAQTRKVAQILSKIH